MVFRGRLAVTTIACACALVGCAVVADLATTYVSGDAIDGGEGVPDSTAEGAPPADAISESAPDDAGRDVVIAPDAPADAPPADACAVPNVLACTDFPNGCPYGVQVNGTGAVTAEAGTLHVTTEGGTPNAFCYRTVNVSPNGFLYDVDIRVNVIDPGGAARAEIVQVEASGTDYTLAIVGGKFRFVGGNAAEMEVTPNLGLGTWQHVAIDVDYGKASATVTIGGNAPKKIPVAEGTPTLTQIDVGFDFLQTTNLPWDVSYDNLLVRAK
jgi:hypothetical protein